MNVFCFLSVGFSIWTGGLISAKHSNCCFFNLHPKFTEVDYFSLTTLLLVDPLSLYKTLSQIRVQSYQSTECIQRTLRISPIFNSTSRHNSLEQNPLNYSKLNVLVDSILQSIALRNFSISCTSRQVNQSIELLLVDCFPLYEHLETFSSSVYQSTRTPPLMPQNIFKYSSFLTCSYCIPVFVLEQSSTSLHIDYYNQFQIADAQCTGLVHKRLALN